MTRNVFAKRETLSRFGRNNFRHFSYIEAQNSGAGIVVGGDTVLHLDFLREVLWQGREAEAPAGREFRKIQEFQILRVGF
jgi:hypothetical protein